MSDHIFQGVHSMPAMQYRKAHGISKSDLDLIAISPAHYRAREERAKETEATRMGTLIHSAILEPDSLAFHVKPEGMNFATKEGKAWKLDHQSAPIITSDEWKTMTGIVASVHGHPMAKRLLSGGQPERCLFAKDKHGVVRKGRLDFLPDSGNVIVDVKTCEDASPREFEKSIYNYRYHAQGAYYTGLANLCGYQKEIFVIIAVEKSPPYAVAVYRVDQEALDFGRHLVERDMTVYRRCVETGKWPGYSEDVEEIGLPLWARKEMEAAL